MHSNLAGMKLSFFNQSIRDTIQKTRLEPAGFFVIRNSTSKCTLILLSSSEHKTKIQNIWDICAFTAVVKALALSGAQCAFTTLISLIYFISKMCQHTLHFIFDKLLKTSLVTLVTKQN